MVESGRTAVQRAGSGGGGTRALSALSAPGAPMFAPAGAQQSLQRHLHKRLEVIASLPSAVLRGDQTQTDTFTGDTADHVSSIDHQLKRHVRPAHICGSHHTFPGQKSGFM